MNVRRVVVPPVLLGVAVSLVTAAFVAVVGPRERARALAEWQLRLTSQAEDRKAALDLWLESGLDDARLVASYPTVRFLAEARTTGPSPFPVEEGPQRHLDDLLGEVAAAGRYRAASVVDGRGAVAGGWSGGATLAAECTAAAVTAAAGGSAGVSLCADGTGRGSVLFAAPVGTTGTTVVLAASPEEWLFPFVAGEPSPTSTAETVLMSRDGDQAVFVAPLRHVAGAPFTIRRPLSTPGFAARAALDGLGGAGRFVDYRGVAVIAATRRLGNAHWGLVVKVDEAEALAPVERQVWAETLALAAALLAIGIGGLAVRRALQGRRIRERLSQLERQEALRYALASAEQRLKAFFDAGTVGMLFGDVHGNIQEANDELLRIIGYSRDELRSGAVRWIDLTPPEFLPLDEAGIEEARRRGACTPYEKQYIRKDGGRIWILVGYHLLGEAREQSVAFIVDISRQKEAESQRLALQRERDVLLARLERQVSSLPIGLFTLAGDLTIIDVNPTGERICGFTREELVGSSLLAAVIPDRSRAFMAGFLARLREGEGVREAVADLLTKDGRTLTCHWHDTPLRDERGELVGILAMVQDVSDRLRTEEALRASEARFRSAFEGAAVGMALISPDGTMLDVNRALCSLLGRDRAELLGLRSADVVHPDEATLEHEAAARLLAGESALSRAERRFLREDGNVVWATVSDVLLRDGSGRAQFVIRHVLDVTDRKRAEEALRASESLYHDLVETSQDLIWQCDAEGRYSYLNPAWEAVLGYPPEEMVGRPFSDFQHPEAAERDRAEFARLLRGGSVKGYLATHLARDGREVHLVFNAKTVVDAHGNHVGTRGTAYDITEWLGIQRALEEREELLAETGRIAKVGGWELDAATGLGSWTDEVARIHGVDPGDPIGLESVLSFYRDASRQRLESAVRAAVARGESYELELELVTPQGERRWVRTIGHPVLEDGRVVKVRASVQDISERRLAEEALAAHEVRYRELFGSIQEGFAIHEIVLDDGGRPVDYRFVDINPAFTRLVGLGPEILGRTVREVIPDIEPEWIERYGRVALTGEPCRFESYSAALGKHFEVNAFSPSRGRFATAFVDITLRKLAEEALAANEERFRQLFESMSDGVAVYRAVDDGADFVFTELNPAGERISGTPRERVLGRRVSEAFPGIGELGLLAVFREVWRDGEARRHPVSMYQDERLTMWVENLVYRLPTGEIVAVYSDATERKRAEADLAESERALATLMSNLPGMAYRCANRPDWPMEVVSEGSAALTGYAPDELQAGGVASFGDLIVPEERAEVWEEVQRAIGERRPFELNYRIVTRDGSVRWVWERGQAIRRPDGAVRALEGFISDITERRAAEEALRQERDRAQRYLDLAGVIFVALDREGRVTLVNPKACEVLRVAPEEIVGVDWVAGFIPEAARSRVRQTFRRLVAGEIEPMEHYENPVLTRSGEVRLIAWHNALLRDDDGTILGTLSSGEDVTESRAAADALRALRLRLAEAEEAERRRLARELHDQVGQSLTALGINLSIIRQKVAPAGGAEVEKRLDDSRGLVDEVVAQVRDVMAALRPSVLDDYGLPAALEWTAGQFEERTGISCSVVAPESERRLPAPLETALFRIAQEALTNVARHAGASRVTVELEVGDQVARLSVRDDGVGFDPAAPVSGRMGLASMQERAVAVGGRLDIRSAAGRGVAVIAEVPTEVA